jgi:hypothetical protein
MGGGGGRGELSRTYEGGAVSASGFSGDRFVPPNGEEVTVAVDHAIGEYSETLAPPLRQLRELGSLKDLVQASLRRELHVDGVNVVGSVAKGTQIDRPGQNDIDVEFVLDREAHGDWLSQANGPRNCLSKVREVLSTDPRFTNVEVRVDRNTVTAEFGDAKIDIIPAFRDPEGGVLIPDTVGSEGWARSNPRLSKRILQAQDQRWDGQVTQTIKIAKKWGEAHAPQLSSTHIEAIVLKEYSLKPPDGENSSRTHVQEFFARLPWLLQNTVDEPVYRQRIDGYLSPDDRSRAISRALRTASKFARAEKLAREGDDPDGAADAFREALYD